MITNDFILYYFLIGLFVSLALSRVLAFIDNPITSKQLWLYPVSIVLWCVPVFLGVIIILVSIEEWCSGMKISVIYEKIAKFLLKDI